MREREFIYWSFQLCVGRVRESVETVQNSVSDAHSGPGIYESKSNGHEPFISKV
jgi:hypothetical protein